MKEIWRDIKDYEGLYQISSKGRVKSLERKDCRNHLVRERIRKPFLTTKGYFCIELSKNCYKQKMSIHRLVAETFVKNPYNKPCVNHKDGIKAHNYDYNLEWCTLKENDEHARKYGLINTQGENNGRAKLTKENVIYILNSDKLQKDLALEFGMHPSVICEIKNRKTWKHITN